MTNSNPRLKHVKNIQLTIQTLLWDIERNDMDIEVTKQYIKDILDQCNLLLETKKAKKKKCRICGKKISLNLDGNYHEESLHKTISVTDPKEEMREIEFLECEVCSKNPGSPVLCNGCLNDRAVIDRVNILSKSK